jgi:hypothetical protein
VVEELAQLPLEFPSLRPEGKAVSSWADAAAAGHVGKEDLEEGISLLAPKERRRIERAHADEFPAVWRALCADLGGDEELARRAVVAGAVVAAVRERQPPNPDVLALLEESADLRRDGCEALAFVLEASDLWSVYESIEIDQALRAIPDELDDEAYDAEWHRVIAAEAVRLRTRWHDERLKLLVSRLRAQLALPDYPRTSAVLMTACDAFQREKAERRRLAALLLADSLSLRRAGLPLAA